MVKKKGVDTDEMSVPIPIQTFLWRQTSPFMRAKLTKICESSAVSFERVLVQNILHGLSPSLCEAISSVKRWSLIRAAFPHVIHCCSSALTRRKENGETGKYSSLETKLLYTLHWVILDAASECYDADPSGDPSYLHSLDTIQLFIFLLIPLLSTIKRPEIESLKLLNGLRLWEPLWRNRQPDVSCFITPVKAKKTFFKPVETIPKVNFNTANIYLGEESDKENIGEDEPPIVRMCDICALSNRSSMEESLTLKFDGVKTDIFSLNLEHRESLEQKKEQTRHSFLKATYFDVASLQCLFCPQWKSEGIVWTLGYLVNRLTEIKQEIERTKKTKKRSNSLPAIKRNFDDESEKKDIGKNSKWNSLKDNKKRLTQLLGNGTVENIEETKERKGTFECTTTNEKLRNKKKNNNNNNNNTLRSSDTKINYNHQEALSEVPGSTFYISSEGHLKYDVLLLAVYNLPTKHYNKNTCNSILNIINLFIELGLLKKKKVTIVDKKDFFNKSGEVGNKEGIPKTVKSGWEDIQKNSCSEISLAFEIIFRLIRAMGCVENCRNFPLKIPAFFRDAILKCLALLIDLDVVAFKRFALKVLCKQPLQNILECLHGLLTYCSEQKTHVTFKLSDSSYKNSFGEPSWHLNTVANKVVIVMWKSLLSKLVEKRKEIVCPDNLHIYQGARQLVEYMKAVNGNTFRKSALSFLLQAGGNDLSRGEKEQAHKPLAFFKKKQPSYPLHLPSEDMKRHTSPRTSVFAISDDEVQLICNKKKSLKNLRGKRLEVFEENSENEDDEEDDGGGSKDVSMSFKATGQAALKFLKAKRKIKDGFKSLGSKHQHHQTSLKRKFRETSIADQIQGDTEHTSRTNISDIQQRIINLSVLKSGLSRFSMLLELSNPGVLPDSCLIAALLDLEAPVIGRAALLLECCHFVNKCNHGNWPSWMKYNMIGVYGRDGQSVANRNIALRRTAGKLFHQWAECLGNRLSEIMINENPDVCSVIISNEQHVSMEEDFLVDETVNSSGSDCPHALKMLACQLLYEITAFLRETYKNLPKRRPSKTDRRSSSKDPDRRWSSIMSEVSHEDKATISARPEAASQNHNLDRKISFTLSHQRSDSVHESVIQQASNRRSRLLRARRGSEQVNTFKHNRSFKLIRNADATSLRKGSTKSRKISTQSLHSATSAEEAIGSPFAIFEEEEEEDEEDDNKVESKNSLYRASHDPIGRQSSMSTNSQYGTDESFYERYMPWIKVVVQLANKSNFVCEHQVCHPNCYERQRKSCLKLVQSLKKVYSASLIPPVSSSDGNISHQAPKLASNSFSEKAKNKASKDGGNDPNKIKAFTSNYKNSQKTAEDKDSILNYLEKHVANLTHSPLAVVAKSTPILKDEIFIDIMPVAWELILESDQELSAAAAAVFLISSIQVPEQMRCLLASQFHHNQVSVRTAAITRFGVLWNSRFQVWPRMETGAQNHFKLPPPNIDFVVPSPTIGLSALPVVDPPWTPHFRSKLEDVAIEQKDMNSVVTATTTRRKQQQKMMKKAMIAKEDKRKHARERCWMTSVPVCQAASVEPLLSLEDHEDAIPEELSLAVAARRMSVAAVNRASNIKNLSARHGSIFYSRPTMSNNDDERLENAGFELQVVQPFFPSTICQSAVNLIYLLSDLEVNKDGISVSEITEKTIWRCLVEDPSLFLRTFLEKLTVKTAYRELIWLIRRMLGHLKIIPLQTAHCIFNYLLGYVMFYERLPSEQSIECVTEAMSLIWQIAPFVSNIFFKDLKQTLRKEQCDGTLLVATNAPSAKKLIIHGPDLSSIPSQYIIQEDTQFEHLLQESLEFFNVPPEFWNEYFLVDTKTRGIHSSSRYVRDHYPFKRNVYPQLSLVQLDPDRASACLQKQAFMLKYLEVGKVLFSLSILNSSKGAHYQNHVDYLHDELLRLPSFPRKALETEFSFYHSDTGQDIMAIDVLHKLSWIRLTDNLLNGMCNLSPHESDLPIFLNVFNGIFIIHNSSTIPLRCISAAYINVTRHFKHVFASSGFSYILPTILSVYVAKQHNHVVCNVINFLCKCFYVMHRNVFVLQLLASMAILLEETDAKGGCKDQVSGILFQLLTCLGREVDDSLVLLQLLHHRQPLHAFDFCHKEEGNNMNLFEWLNLCCTVVLYNPDCSRSHQMLTILESILPHYLNHVEVDLNFVCKLSVLINTLVGVCDHGSRSFTKSHLDPTNKMVSNKEEVHEFSRLVSTDNTTNNKKHVISPRNNILLIVCHYYKHCYKCVRGMSMLDPNFKSPELLDHKSHLKLAETAYSLLKLSTYDPLILSCRGLLRYMKDILGHTNWSQANLRSALLMVLKRVERLLYKIFKNSVPLNKLNWENLTSIIEAIDTALCNCPVIGHLPQLKSLVSVLLQMITSMDNETDTPLKQATSHQCPKEFSTLCIRLSLRLLRVLKDTYSLQSMCEDCLNSHVTAQKLMKLVCYFIVPATLSFTDHQLINENLEARSHEVEGLLSLYLHAIHPTHRQTFSPSSDYRGGDSRMLLWNNGANQLPPQNFNSVMFLGLKSLIVCFHGVLSKHWHQICTHISQMITHRIGGRDLWTLLDFIVACKGPLFILLLPILKHQVNKQKKWNMRGGSWKPVQHIKHSMQLLKDQKVEKEEDPYMKLEALYEKYKPKIVETNGLENKETENGCEKKGENIQHQSTNDGGNENENKSLEDQKRSDLQNKMASNHVMNHVIDLADGNLLIFHHLQKMKKKLESETSPISESIEASRRWHKNSKMAETMKKVETNKTMTDDSTRLHRLQRQDAKSRRTFKRVMGSLSRRKEVTRSVTLSTHKPLEPKASVSPPNLQRYQDSQPSNDQLGSSHVIADVTNELHIDDEDLYVP